MTVTPHQLRRSAEIMDSETKERTGWADTSDRAERMRAAADRIEELEKRLKGQMDYAIDLQRIIEDLCAGRDIRLPETSARYHYDMAIRFLALDT